MKEKKKIFKSNRYLMNILFQFIINILLDIINYYFDDEVIKIYIISNKVFVCVFLF